MLRFVLRRLLSSVPVLLGIVIATFVLARVIPGDPCKAALGERVTQQACDDFARREGLDRPIFVQFGRYVGNLAHGDLGDSVSQHRPVTDLLIERLPITLQLAVAALFLATLIGVPLGVISAYRHNSKTDVITMVGANIGVSMPVFLLGLLLQYVFAKTLRNTPFSLPPSGLLDAGVVPPRFWDQWGIGQNGLFEFVGRIDLVNSILVWRWDIWINAARHLVLPSLALATIPMAIIARMTRSSLLDVLGLDYVRTARAKGLRERLVVIRHALRNALLPVVTVIGLSLGSLIGGAILTETIFNLTGVGKTLFDAIGARDYTVVQGFTLVIAFSFVIVNLVTDILYTYLDPKVRVT